jgi:ABC-type multidrug transport system fused ATPase/permease subunit
MYETQHREAARYDAHVDYSFVKSCEAGLASAWFEGGVHFAANLSMVAVLSYGGSQVLNHELTAGALTSFLMYSLYVGFNLSSLSTQYSELMRAVGASSRIFGIVDREPLIPSSMTSRLAYPVPTARYKPSISESDADKAGTLAYKFPFSKTAMRYVTADMDKTQVADPSGLYCTGPWAARAAEAAGTQGSDTSVSTLAASQSPPITGNIEFRDVCFSYPIRTEDPVLSGFNLSLKAGETCALVGTSGSGKSSVGALLSRLYDPTSGEIVLDGHDIRTIDPHWLRSKIGVVSQEPSLFAVSVRDNIIYGDPTKSEADVLAAAEASGTSRFLSSFPDGLDTMVGERGVQLSGGQKQRVAIARALLKDPPILVLDEATSALDSESEAVVQEALDALMKSRTRTTLVIAHRLSTIKHADKIVVLDGGQIVEQGTHEELIRQGTLYPKLYQRQQELKV